MPLEVLAASAGPAQQHGPIQIAKEVLFYEKPWGDKKVYDMIQHAATKTWFKLLKK